MSDTPDKKNDSKAKVIVSQNEQGQLEGRTREGDLLWQEVITKPQAKKLAKGEPIRRHTNRQVRYMYVFNQVGEKVLVPAGFNLDNLPLPRGSLSSTVWEFSDAVASQICLLVSEGFSLEEIGRMEAMPSRFIIGHWVTVNKRFAEELQKARTLRAEYYHDSIHGIAHTVKEGTAKSDKVKLDALRYLAGVNDPDRFGNRTKLVGDPNAPVGITVETGIRRGPEHSPAIPVEGGTVEDDDEAS